MKDKLEAMGLNETQIDEILNLVKNNKGDYIPRSRLNETLNTVKDLKDKLVERDEMIKSLKTSNVDDLKFQIDELKKSNLATTEMFKKELVRERARAIIAKNNAFDDELVLSLLDCSKDINEQIDNLKESKSFLFQKKNNNSISGNTPAISGNIQEVEISNKDSFLNDLGQKLAQMTNRNNGK